MKIGSTHNPLNPGSTPRLVAKDGVSAGQAGETAPKDPVSLSELSRKLTAMESRMHEGGIDSSRVNAIKTAIRNGEFKVNAEAVAERLLQNVQDMLSGKA